MFKAIHVPDFGAPFRDVEIVTSGKLPELVRTYGALALLMHNSAGLNMTTLHAMAADITIQRPPPSGRSQTSSDIPLCWLLRCALRIAPQLARRRPVEGSAIKRCDINHFCCIPTLSPPPTLTPSPSGRRTGNPCHHMWRFYRFFTARHCLFTGLFRGIFYPDHENAWDSSHCHEEGIRT